MLGTYFILQNNHSLHRRKSMCWRIIWTEYRNFKSS